MALSRQERILLHKKSQSPHTGVGAPSNLEGKDGETAYRRLPGVGTVHYIKRDGEWQALSSTDRMPAKRSTIRVSGGAGSGITDHGGMSGIADDDHTQYLLVDGTRAMTSAMTIGTDADGTDRSITWGHSTLKTIIGIDDSSDAFVINTDAAFDGTLANNSFSIDASHNVIIAGGLTVGADADGTDRTITWGHSTLKTIIGIDDSADAFVINTDAAFDGTLANNSLTIDSNHNVGIAGDLTLYGADITIGSDADGTNRTITFGHSTLKTIMGIRDATNVFIINTDASFESNTIDNSFALDTNNNCFIGGDIWVGDDIIMNSSGSVISWYGSDVTLTHSSGKLTLGGDGSVEIDFNDHEMTNVDINSGTIDGTTIGASNHTTIKGTTIDATTDFTVGTTIITDDQIQFMPTQNDYVTIAGSSHGSLNITTVDQNAAAANIVVTADGTLDLNSVDLDIDASGAITIDGVGVSIDSSSASNLTTSSGALTITSAAAATWSTAAGALTLTSAGAATWSTADGILTLSGYSGVNIAESGSAVIGIDTNRDVLFSQTDGSSGDPDVEIDGYLVVDGTGEFNGTLQSDSTADFNGTIDADVTDFDVASSGDIDLVSTNNAVGAITIHANGGTNETVLIRSVQGTASTEGAASVQLLSDVGGINIKSGLNNANAILLTADGGISETIVLHSDQGTGAASIALVSDVGGITLDAGLDIALSADGDQISMDDGTTTRFTFNVDSTPELDVTGNFILDGSGTIQLDSAGNLITLTSTKVHQQSPYTLGGVDGYMHRIDGIGQMFNLGDADFIANYSIHTNHDNITSTCDTSFADTNGAGWEAGA
jgi:hypothetical protein